MRLIVSFGFLMVVGGGVFSLVLRFIRDKGEC